MKVITGVRRSGKSTIFYQLIERLLKERNIPSQQILLVNFEDEALTHFTLEEIFNAYQAHLSPRGEIYLFLMRSNRNWNGKGGYERDMI